MWAGRKGGRFWSTGPGIVEAGLTIFWARAVCSGLSYIFSGSYRHEVEARRRSVAGQVVEVVGFMS